MWATLYVLVPQSTSLPLSSLSAEVPEIKRGNPEVTLSGTTKNPEMIIIRRYLQLAVSNEDRLNKLIGGVTIAQDGVLPLLVGRSFILFEDMLVF